MDQIDFWTFIADEINTAGCAGLVKVVEAEGSSPGKKGFAMAINASGEIRGTIGGGVMESRVIDEMMSHLNKKSFSAARKILRHKKNVPDASGLICAGSQTIVMIQLRKRDTFTIAAIINALMQRKQGKLSISNKGLSFSASSPSFNSSFEQKATGEWLYEENCGREDTVYIFGSGHVGLACAKIFSTIGFYVVCFDNRPGAPTVLYNTYANEIIIGPYENAPARLTQGPGSYVVIVTSDRDSDAVVLSSLVRMDLPYIGLMGSDAKAASIFKELKASGIREEEIAKVKSPIGVPILSATPDEIAISIAAEIIDIRNKRLYGGNAE